MLEMFFPHTAFKAKVVDDTKCNRIYRINEKEIERGERKIVDDKIDWDADGDPIHRNHASIKKCIS